MGLLEIASVASLVSEMPGIPSRRDVFFDGAFGGVGDKEVIVREDVVVISSSLDMLTNSCLGRIIVSLIFLEGLDEEALVEFMVEWYEEEEDDDRIKRMTYLIIEERIKVEKNGS
uniref:Uncharacterized protein n=1 Tax=Tanacetum cinerariifolium TaxID=118510 RepID=A0A6L2KVY4_TANCI|nr:hypothetical protein [Tanacetum cinerariifolium]